MKKVISLMLIIAMVMMVSTTVLATDSILGDNATTITPEDYNNAQTTPENDANNNANTNDTSLPQTGIEDSGVGILLVVCVASAIFAYRKISDYRNI